MRPHIKNTIGYKVYSNTLDDTWNRKMRTKIINSLQNLMVCFLVLILKIDRMFQITFRVLDSKSGHRITNFSCSDGGFPNYRCLDEVFLYVSDFFLKNMNDS